MSAWVAYTSIAALAMAGSLVHYRWREPGGRGRTVLGLLRGAALALIVLLLFDPAMPTGAAGDRPVVALVDGSLSMSLEDADGVRRWDAARRMVETSAPDRILLFGSEEPGAVADLNGVAPTAARSRLGPALRSALEAGAERVVVVTDGAIDDLAEARRTAAEAGVPIEVRLVAGETRANLAVESVRAPSWLEADAASSVRVVVHRSGQAGPGLPDSATVTLGTGGRELARAGVRVPPPGRSVEVELSVRPDSSASGPVRLDVAVDPGGAVAEDDVRSVYVRIAEEPAGVALVSFRPDQEPRFLMPVLERALGVPVRGWLSLAGARFVAVGAGPDAGQRAEVGTVRAALEEAGMVVLHGMSAEAAEWAHEALRGADRILVFPGDPPPEAPVPMGPLRAGEWYLEADVPSSPVAALLAGLDPATVPPLTGLRRMEGPAGYWTPLWVRRGRSGEREPVAVVGRAGERRVAVAAGEGYWRWAFAGGASRDAYARLWSAVAGWLGQDVEGEDREAIRPLSRAVRRGEAVRWLAPGDSLHVTLTGPGAGDGVDGDEAAMESRDTVVVVTGGGATTAAPGPGHYRYTARSGGVEATGPLTVESYSPELAAEPMPLELEAGEGEDPARARSSRPLHTAAWPYILIVALLCGEWVMRRRWGLR